jgi:glycosyltransferase involved in cell wall biosynthesis
VLDLPRYLTRVRERLDDDRRPFLAVAGEGPLANELRARLDETGGDGAVLGYVPEPLPLIRAADLLVLLSSAEGMCQALVQATALGTPFVAYDVDGVRELIELGASGTAVPLGDVEAAAAASAEALLSARPDGISIDLSTWSPGAIAEGYRRLIATALGSSTATGPSADPVAVAS